MFTEERISEILAVCEKATPEPWHIVKNHLYHSEIKSDKRELIACIETVKEGSEEHNAQFIALARTALPQLAEEVIKLRAVAEVAKHFYGICFDMPIDFPSAGPFVWGMGDLKDALAAAGYGGEK